MLHLGWVRLRPVNTIKLDPRGITRRAMFPEGARTRRRQLKPWATGYTAVGTTTGIRLVGRQRSWSRASCFDARSLNEAWLLQMGLHGESFDELVAPLGESNAVV